MSNEPKGGGDSRRMSMFRLDPCRWPGLGGIGCWKPAKLWWLPLVGIELLGMLITEVSGGQAAATSAQDGVRNADWNVEAD